MEKLISYFDLEKMFLEKYLKVANNNIEIAIEMFYDYFYGPEEKIQDSELHQFEMLLIGDLYFTKFGYTDENFSKNSYEYKEFMKFKKGKYNDFLTKEEVERINRDIDYIIQENLNQ